MAGQGLLDSSVAGEPVERYPCPYCGARGTCGATTDHSLIAGQAASLPDETACVCLTCGWRGGPLELHDLRKQVDRREAEWRRVCAGEV